MKRLRIYLFIALTSGFSSSVFAETIWCQVELIVFAQRGPSNEVFDQTASHIEWPSELVELSDSPMSLAELKQMPLPYISLQSADRSLTAAYETLHLQGGYRPLLHIAWVQPLDGNSANAAVHIQGGGEAGAETVDGFVRVENSADPQFHADLEYTSAAAQDAAPNIYRLRERRRMPFGEVQYLDHPKFGVIVRLSSLQ